MKRMHTTGWIGAAGILMLAALTSFDELKPPAVRGADANHPAAIPAPDGWKLVWNDEFDGGEIDAKKWDFDRGNSRGGWGNNELECYTSRAENAFIKDGSLHVQAIRESYNGFHYTSARLKTKGLFSRKYGRFDFRAKLPTGKGIWPAIWLLPQENKYGGWPASGEIDIMESRGQEPRKVLGTLHYGSRAPGNTYAGKDYILPDNATIADWHIYSLEWEPGEIRWLVDGKAYETQDFWWSCSKSGRPRGAGPASEADLNPWPAPFDQPFYIILNVAVGGRFLGNPDDGTAFPVEMSIDYVRVYEKAAGDGEPKPRGEGKLPFKHD